MNYGAVVYVKDLSRAVDFYAQVGGLPVVHREDSYALLGTAPFQLVLHRIPPQWAATIEIASPPQRREDTPIKLIFLVPSLAQARAAAARLGGQVDDPASEWRFQAFTVRDGHDPEGNVFQLRQVAG